MAAKRAWYPAADAAPTMNVPINIKKILLREPPIIANKDPIAPAV